MKKVSFFALLLICCLLLIVGCSSNQQQDTPKAGGYEVQDSQGYVIKLPHKPSRIVSLSLGTDEILVDLVPLERILALTYLADDPEISNISEQAKLVSKKVKANPEAIIALRPDVLFIADWQPIELIQTIRDAGVPVYVYKTPSTIEDVKYVIREIAHVVGEEQMGQQMVAQMDKQLGTIQKSLEKVRNEERKTVVLFSLMGGIGGQGSLFDDICRYAGVVNGASKVGIGKYEMMTKEQIIAANPDVFIMPTWNYNGKTKVEDFKAGVRDDPAFQSLGAIQKEQLYTIPDRHLSSSSQYIVQGVVDVAKAAYPQYNP